MLKDHNLECQVLDMYDQRNKEMKEKYGIQGIPDTICTNDDGEEIGHVLGNMVEDLARRQIDYYISVCQ